MIITNDERNLVKFYFEFLTFSSLSHPDNSIMFFSTWHIALWNRRGIIIVEFCFSSKGGGSIFSSVFNCSRGKYLTKLLIITYNLNISLRIKIETLSEVETLFVGIRRY